MSNEPDTRTGLRSQNSGKQDSSLLLAAAAPACYPNECMKSHRKRLKFIFQFISGLCPGFLLYPAHRPSMSLSIKPETKLLMDRWFLDSLNLFYFLDFVRFHAIWSWHTALPKMFTPVGMKGEGLIRLVPQVKYSGCPKVIRSNDIGQFHQIV